MFWEILFWLSIGLGALLVILRIVVPALSHRPAPAQDERSGNFLTSGTVFPVIVVVVMAYTFLAKVYPDRIPTPDLPVFTSWSKAEKAELTHLTSSLNFYDNANTIASNAAGTDEDWESVRALLTAALDESALISDDLLQQVHEELPDNFNDYKEGLRLGVYSLSVRPAEGSGKLLASSDKYELYNDSLAVSRELLTSWGDWYAHNAETIKRRIAP